jgi:hypothetical protein
VSLFQSLYGLNIAVDFDGTQRPRGTAPDIGAYEVANRPPIASDDAVVTDEGTPVTTGNVMANDSDPDSDALAVADFTQAKYSRAVVTHNGDGTFVYKPEPNFNGQDSFTYTITDGHGGTATATVRITVRPVNTPPVITTTPAALTYPENSGPMGIDADLTVSDDDSPNLVSAAVWLPTNYASEQDTLGFTNQNGITGSFNSSTGTLTLTGVAPVAAYQAALRAVTYLNSSENPSVLPRTMAFRVNDGEADSNTATRLINVVPTPAKVVAVVLNGRAGRSVGAIEPSGIGVRTITVQFSRSVTFDEEEVIVEKVTFPNGVEHALSRLTPTSISSSGTNVMTISFATASVLDTWVKVTLIASGIRDASNQALDGEPRSPGSGRGYIYSAALDLPTGDGVPGGDAVFCVGSLRGDFDGDGLVTEDDMDAFMAKYQARDLDADVRGVGFAADEPDGQITASDFDGFISIYEAAIAEGHRLDPLPSGRSP